MSRVHLLSPHLQKLPRKLTCQPVYSKNRGVVYPEIYHFNTNKLKHVYSSVGIRNHTLPYVIDLLEQVTLILENSLVANCYDSSTSLECTFRS